MPSFSIKVNGAEELKAILTQIKLNVESCVSSLLDVLASEGESYAINYLGHIDTGTTLASISALRKGKQAIILAGGNAIWVEFGTGVIRNSGNTHPEVVDSEVPIYPHGGYGKGRGKYTQGWWYYSDTQPNHSSYTRAKNGGYYVHTKGIPQNMFMYHTYEKLVDKLPEYAKECFKEVFKK